MAKRITHKQFAERVNAFHPLAKGGKSQVFKSKMNTAYDWSYSRIETQNVAIQVEFYRGKAHAYVGPVGHEYGPLQRWTSQDLLFFAKYATEVAFLLEKINE